MATQTMQPLDDPGSPLSLWLRELRAYSLTASVTPVLLAAGAATALRIDFPLWLLPSVLATALLLHIGTNLVNDAADLWKGVDRPGTTGGSGMLTRGWLQPRAVYRVGIGFMVVGAVAGIPVILARGWPVVLLGLLGALGGYAYTAGPAYKYKGLGDFGVFLLMGPVLVLSAFYALTGCADPPVLLRAALATLPIGLLVTAILAVNNHRDLDDDRSAGITTLALVLGARWSRRYVVALVVGPFAVTLALVVLKVLPLVALLSLVAVLPAAGLIRDLIRLPDGRSWQQSELVERTAKVHAVYGVLLTIALFVSPRL